MSNGKRVAKSTQSNGEKKPNILSRIGTLNITLIIVAILFIVFNFQMIDLYRTWGSMPETYASAIVLALLGEAGICGKIFTSKLKHKNQQMNNPPPYNPSDTNTPDPTNPVDNTTITESVTEESNEDIMNAEIPENVTDEVVDSNTAVG